MCWEKTWSLVTSKDNKRSRNESLKERQTEFLKCGGLCLLAYSQEPHCNETQGSVMAPVAKCSHCHFWGWPSKQLCQQKTSPKGTKGKHWHQWQIQTFKLKDGFSADVGPSKAQGPQSQSPYYLHPNSLSWYSHLSKQESIQIPREGFCTFKLYFPRVNLCLRALKDVQVFRWFSPNLKIKPNV